ncbi:MAG: DUF349 domain-containing protein [Arhodomonas sp.]|nr:DUF349 domain-containing protein [Arhodomonas sp.]
MGLINRLERALREHGDDTPEQRARLWLEAGRRYLALVEPIATVEDELHALSELEERLDWPPTLPIPGPVARLREALARHREAEAAGVREGDEDRRELLERLDAALTRVEEALDSGTLRRARRELRGINNIVSAVPGSLDPGRERRLARARAGLAELSDWRRFAVLPQQEALCERMEGLGEGDGLTAEARLSRVRELFAEWRQTGGSDSAESRALWQRFRTAAEKARGSCAEWLESRERQCRHNAEERERLVTQLSGFLEGTDLSTVALPELVRIRRTARRDWQGLVPVEDREIRGLTRRFEALMDRLSAHIDERRQRLHEARRQLVAEAQALTEHDDPEAAAESAKALQRRWKATEATGTGPERRLWREFRGACDRIFEARDRARAERRKAADDGLAEARGVAAELERLGSAASGDSDDPADLETALSALESRWEALTLPAGRAGQEVARRYERGRKAVREELQARRRLAVLARVEAALAADAPGDAPEDLPAPLRDAVRARGADATPAHDVSTQRDLCLRMEILAGVESPEPERPRRMELQVERLANGLGGETTEDQGLWSLLGRWYARPATEPALAERFRRAAEAALRSVP